MFAYACCVQEGAVSPSASSIFGMSRNFSATSKAVFRLPMGSSCRETRYCTVLLFSDHKISTVLKKNPEKR